jgi:hypothetical protein
VLEGRRLCFILMKGELEMTTKGCLARLNKFYDISHATAFSSSGECSMHVNLSITDYNHFPNTTCVAPY